MTAVADSSTPTPTVADDLAVDALALAQLAPLGGHYLPWTDYSMRPAAIAEIVSEVAIGDRRLIVECGSGNSTVFVARFLQQRGSDARLISIDSDARWAEA